MVKVGSAFFAVGDDKNKQEAQVLQKNSASAGHMEGAGPAAHSPADNLYLKLLTDSADTYTIRQTIPYRYNSM